MFQVFLKWILEKPVQRSLGTIGGGASLGLVLYLHEDIKADTLAKLESATFIQREYTNSKFNDISKDISQIKDAQKEIKHLLQRLDDRIYNRGQDGK